VNKISLVIALIIAVGVMLVIPSPIGHVAKASTCSTSLSSGSGNIGSGSFTTSGSCSISGAVTSSSLGLTGSRGKSACSSTSASKGSVSNGGDVSSGAVSCSAHSP
jgi:hypothetical protein